MKLCLSLALTFATAAFVAAQTPVTVPSPFQTPAAPPDAPKPVISPDTVVVTVEGKPYKAKEMDVWLAQFPPQVTDAVGKNPEMELTRLFAMQALSTEARKRKLDQISPYKDAIDSRVRNYLANILVQDEGTRTRPTEAEQKAYYDTHQDQYQSVKISAIYVNYTPSPKPGADGKMPRTEAEAKTKAEGLVKQLRAGGDFAKLASANSDDVESAKKGGDYATIRRSDNYPAAIKEAIFKLKDGEISDPVKQVPGFYIFKVTARITQPFTEVQPTLFERVTREKVDTYVKNLQKEMTPTVNKPEYFTGVKPESAPGPANATPIPPAPIAPDTVVVTVAGKGYTAREMEEMMKILPPQAKTAMAKEPEPSLTSLFMIMSLSDEARKRKLDTISPNREAIAMYTMDGLTNAIVVETRNNTEVTPAETETYYKSHLEQFEVAKVSAILVSFGAGRKEEDAKTRADDLVKQLRSGADFATLAKSSSDDKDSAAKGGEYATVRRADKIAEAMKKVIFALKVNEVSDAVKQPAGFYIFKVTSKLVQPLAEVSAALTPGLKQEKFTVWMNGLQTTYKPKIEKPEYFKK